MRKLFLGPVLFLYLSAALFAQSTALTGTVTDPTGAVIPNVSITIVNTETGVQRQTVSDTQGRYTMDQVMPGNYKLTAKSPGFADVSINNLKLLVNQPATLPVVFEKLGTTSETVSVEAGAAQVNTVDATLGNAIRTQQITQLPSFARNVAALLQFEPGVTQNGNVNGGKSDQGNITLDGADVNSQNNRSAMTSVLNVTLDSVEEFRVTTTNGNADEGRSSGAQITLVTKSGTNTLHGSLYEYRRGTETAANDYFNNQAGLPRAALLINIFGGSAGGAIKKNRLFYFINYEGRRDASGSTVVQTVPSDTLRAGILQYRNTAGGTTVLTPAQVTALDPAGIGPSKASLDLFSLYPHANDTTVGDQLNSLGFRFNAGQHNIQNTYISRMDWVIDSQAHHTMFVRGQLQNFWKNGTPQFPGQDPSSVSLDNSKGLAVGYTAMVKPNLVSTFRYGFTRQGIETTGVLSGNYASFRGFSTIYPTSTGTARIIPVHSMSEEIAWIKGSHDVHFGAVARFISNRSSSNSNSFSNASSNPSWLFATAKELQPADLAGSFRTNETYAAGALLGILAQGNALYNYDTAGNVLPQGSRINRDFRNQEYEWYVQDTWKVSRSFTVTLGLRHSLMPPIYEAGGAETTAIPSLNDWFYQRADLAAIGAPQSLVAPIQYVLANSKQGHDLYPNHLKNFAPRVALAYSPQGTSGLSRFLFGSPGQTSIRAGFGMFYDLFGQPLAQTYSASALGFSTTLQNPPNILTALTAPRYTGFYNLPASLLPAAPKGGFPQTQPDIFQITNSIDDKILPPYTMNMNFSIGRELKHGWFIQGSYVGRLSRRSIATVDLAEPTNLKDPKSGQTYFQAAQIVATMAKTATTTAQLQAITQKVPFWENIFPGLATGGLTATQQAVKIYGTYAPDYTSGLQAIDQLCSPSCSIYGPYALFNSQYSALSTFSSVGKGSYNSMQWTVRKRFTEGLTLDFNWTYGHSLDLASTNESGGSYSGLIQNAWFPRQVWSNSNYDARHIFNAFAVWQLPFGKGHMLAGGANRVVNGIIGGWQVSPTVQFSTATPVSVGDGGNWATDWEISTYADQVAPVSTQTTKNAASVAGASGPNLFANPKAALAAYDFALPGESGQRNVLRSPGPFAINMGLSKEFTLFTHNDTPHKLQFRWESFNLTNTVRFTGVSLSLGSSTTFGKFGSDSGPRQMQFALRYSF